MSDLKPCPFCGGEGKDLCSREDLYAIGCDNPLCAVEPRTAMHSSPENAQDEWNTRPASVPVEALREIETTLTRAKIFLRTREKMHPEGVALHDKCIDLVLQFIDQAERRE